MKVICHISSRNERHTLGRLQPALPSRLPTPQPTHIQKIISKKSSSGSRKTVSTRQLLQYNSRHAHTLEARASIRDCAAPNPEYTWYFSAGAFRLPGARRKLPLKARDLRTKILLTWSRLFCFRPHRYRCSLTKIFVHSALSEKSVRRVPSECFAEVSVSPHFVHDFGHGYYALAVTPFEWNFVLCSRFPSSVFLHFDFSFIYNNLFWLLSASTWTAENKSKKIKHLSTFVLISALFNQSVSSREIPALRQLIGIQFWMFRLLLHPSYK